MSQTAVIAFNSYGKSFAFYVFAIRKGFGKTFPMVARNAAERNPETAKFRFQFERRGIVPLPPNESNDFAALPFICILQPDFVFLVGDKCMKFIDFQLVVIEFGRSMAVTAAPKHTKHFGSAVSGNGTNTADTATSCGHNFDCMIGFGVATLIGQIVIADELPLAAFTQIVLFTVAFYAVFLYACAAALGTMELYGDFHTFIIQSFTSMPLAFLSSILFRTRPKIFISLRESSKKGSIRHQAIY